MKRLLAAVAAACAVGVLAAGPAPAATDCAPRTAWAGAESASQYDAGMFVTVPLRQAVTLTRLTIDLAYTPHPDAAGFAEVLLLAGVSDTRPRMANPLLPAMPADPAFAPLQVTTTRGAPHNENRALTDGVIAARIVKGPHGAALVDVALHRAMPAGGALWLRVDSVSDHPLDPEVQIVLTYTPASCGPRA